jgi:hypothetical protein
MSFGEREREREREFADERCVKEKRKDVLG